MKRFGAFAIGFMLLLMAAVRAHGSERVALVIGNGAYNHVTALDNPVNDASDMTVALRSVGFDVTTLKNTSFEEMRVALRRFGDKAEGADIAAIFFAGHGIEVSGRNYLIPVDAKLARARDAEFEAISLDLVLNAINSANGLKLVFLDACRTNPFAARMRTADGTRSVGRGLMRIEPAAGTLVSYAAKGGTVASDGKGRNSPYTKAVLEHLDEPGLEINFLFRKVRDTVMDSTRRNQEPFTYGSLSGKRIYLVPPKKEKPKPEPKPIVDSAGLEFSLWNEVKDSQSPDLLDHFLTVYPRGIFAPVAQRKLKRLKAPKGLKVARLETPETRPIAKAPKVADSQVAREPDKQADIQSRNVLVAAIQSELDRLGCAPGPADGKWGRRSQAALQRYAKATATSASKELSDTVLAALKDHEAPICPLVCSPTQVERDGKCVAKTCKSGQKLSSKGVCYTPKKRVATTSGRKSSSGTTSRRTTSSSKNCFKFNGQTVCE